MRKHEGLLHELAGTEQQVLLSFFPKRESRHLADLQRRRQTFHIVLLPVSQLQEQLDAADATLECCPPSLKLRLEEVQEEVVQQWEELRGHAEQRGEELKVACQRFLFLNTVQMERMCLTIPLC